MHLEKGVYDYIQNQELYVFKIPLEEKYIYNIKV